MAGTLSLLAQAGFEPHMMNVSRSNLDSNELPQDEIVPMRLREAERCGCRDRRRLSSAVRQRSADPVRGTAAAADAGGDSRSAPTIVLLPSLNDYMEDHTNTARLVVTACFSRAMRHFASDPPRRATDQDVYLYHAQPHLNRDGMRNLVVPSRLVDISGVMDTKLQMLACHESQRQWLDDTQGLDDYLESMRQSGAELAGMLTQRQWQYAEGFRQHSHVGFSQQDRDLLLEVLGPQRVERLRD